MGGEQNKGQELPVVFLHAVTSSAFNSVERRAKSSCGWLTTTFAGLALVLRISICILMCRCERACVTSVSSYCIFNVIVTLVVEKR